MNYYYNYGYSNDYAMQNLYGIIQRNWFISLVVSAFMIACWWRILTKAGEEGWKSLIPFYGFYVECKIVDYTVYFWTSLFGGLGVSVLAGIVAGISAANQSSTGLVIAGILIIAFAVVILVMGIKYMVKLAKAFGKPGSFAVGLIFLPIIFMAILAFGQAKYYGGAAETQLEKWKCPHCGSYNPATKTYCGDCGTKAPDNLFDK